MSDIHVQHLSHTFPSRAGGIEALADVSFEVCRREVVTVLGPSGCGKSTLLRCLAGLLEPSAGSVSINREAPEALRARKAIGFGFQEPSLMEWRTVEDNIALPAELGRSPSGGGADANRLDKLLAITGLDEFRRNFPRQLSGGMKHRVALARALLLAPEVLLLDEPLAGLDLLTRTELMAEIARVLHEYQCTTVIVTHSVEEAVFWGERILLLTPRPGRIREIVDHPAPLPRRLSYVDAAAYQSVVAHCRHRLLNVESDRSYAE